MKKGKLLINNVIGVLEVLNFIKYRTAERTAKKKKTIPDNNEINTNPSPFNIIKMILKRR